MADPDPYLMRCALNAAAEGMTVFPLRPNTKVPALGRGWQQRATRDPERIRAWWSVRPFNVGLVTGGGLVVVDLDAAKNRGDRHGRQELARVADRLGHVLPRSTRTVVTPSGGQHLYFRVADGVVLRNTAGTLAPRVDTRATGGYVVGPGSTVDGHRYRITDSRPPAPLPDWIRELLQPRPVPLLPAMVRPLSSAYVDAAVRGETDRVAAAAVGTRNVTLFTAAARLGRFVAAGQLSESDVVAVLERACGGFADFGDMEIRRTVRSGLDRAAARSTSRPVNRSPRLGR